MITIQSSRIPYAQFHMIRKEKHYSGGAGGGQNFIVTPLAFVTSVNVAKNSKHSA